MKQSSVSIGTVFYVSLTFAIGFLVWGALFTENLSTVTSAILSFVISSFGWLYLIATTLFLAFLDRKSTRLNSSHPV